MSPFHSFPLYIIGNFKNNPYIPRKHDCDFLFMYTLVCKCPAAFAHCWRTPATAHERDKDADNSRCTEKPCTQYYIHIPEEDQSEIPTERVVPPDAEVTGMETWRKHSRLCHSSLPFQLQHLRRSAKSNSLWSTIPSPKSSHRSNTSSVWSR